ncbi:SH3 domain-containing C40 family peptidase [Desulfovibrio litoralis]|uniref:Cell wall-associated hydrolase, NlpC family n=1 Tax=Desulfovibrio litoralis DSM 11393 TaxID=1121455 RepID=A0A1M7TFN9_9BACT|nr:SH3 domain-containing C40 family peptidase [Desulfovibrio litoralis]SHN69471.1 Cell wall-associated hydrolase, NlpC family [Desulfovibrio litoralis DSM 11393]
MHNLLKKISLICIFLLPLLTTSCAREKQGVDAGFPGSNQKAVNLNVKIDNPYPPIPIVCKDLKDYPQDLLYFAKHNKGYNLNAPLVSFAEQLSHDEKSNQRFLRAWKDLSKLPPAKEIFIGQRYLNPKRGFDKNKQPFSLATWANLEANCNVKAYPARTFNAITVKNTPLRLMPTYDPFLLSPNVYSDGAPFDYFQNSMLWLGTPVKVLHLSADGHWALLSTPAASGWTYVENITEVDESFEAEWRNSKWAAVIQDQVPLNFENKKIQEFGVKAQLGTILPIAKKGHKGSLTLKVPVKGSDGKAKIALANFHGDEAVVKPLALTPNNIARVGNAMIGQPYGWGGYKELRDCSATTKNLYAIFGMWLPRNSAAQASWGKVINLKGMTAQEKEAIIAKDAIPFKSLIWMPGHIGVYIGNHPKTKRPAFFHNVWGIRMKSGLNSVQVNPETNETLNEENAEDSDTCDVNIFNGRLIIGRAVVSSLAPGAELPQVASTNGLLDRIERIVILPEVENKTPVVSKKAVSKKKSKKKTKGNKAKSSKAKKSQKSSKNKKTSGKKK